MNGNIKSESFFTSTSLCVSINMIQVEKGVLPNSLISGSSVLPNGHFLTQTLKMDQNWENYENFLTFPKPYISVV